MNKQQKTYLIAAIGILVIGGLLWWKGNTPSAPDAVIQVGALLPLSGIYAEVAQHSLNGYELAKKEINDSGGINGKQIELLVGDHEGNDGANTISAYRSLRLKGLNLFLGTNDTPTGLAIAPVACEDGALLISPAIGGKDFARTCDTIFDIWPVDYENSREIGRIAVAQGKSRIAIMGSVQTWEQEQATGVREGVQERNGNLVGYVISDNTPSGATADATKIHAANPDAVIFTNAGYMHITAKRLRELGSTAQFYTVIMDESRKNDAEGAFEGAIIVSSFTPTESFKQKYQDAYNKAPDFSSDTSYDALMVMARAMKETDSVDPKVLSQKIVSYRNYQGASGVFSFTSTGDVMKKPIFQRVVNNTIVTYDPAK